MKSTPGPANLFQVLILDGWQGRRALALRLGGALLLAIPFLVLPMPSSMRAGGVSLLAVFSGLFGSVVAAGRLRADGWGERLRLLPLGRWEALADQVLAGALVDGVQLSIPVLGIWMLHGRGADLASAAEVIAALGVSLVVLNAVGVALASRIDGNAEAHLWGGLAVAVVAVLSGLFPLSGRIAGVVEWSEPLLPPHYLKSALLQSMEGGPESGCGAVGAAVLGVLLAAVLWRALDRGALGRRTESTERTNNGRG